MRSNKVHLSVPQTKSNTSHRVLFTGTTTTTITKPLGCTVYGGRMQCLTDEAATWTAPIANVTWRAADKNVLAPS